MDDKWLNDIANQLTDYETKAPAGLWEGIDAKLKGGPARSLRPLLYSVAAIALLCLLIGGTLFFYLPGPQETAHPLADYSLSLQPKPNRPHVDSFSSLDSLSSTRPNSLASADPVTSTLLETTEVAASSPRTAASSTSSPSLPSDSSSIQTVVKRPTSSQPSSVRWSSSSARSHSKPRHPLRVSLLATNMLSDHRTSNGFGGAALMSSEMASAQDPVRHGLQTSYGALDKHLIGNEGARIYDQEKHHKQPVRVGISVAYPLTNRLSIGIGLCYSYLSSDFKTGSEHNYQSAHQSLHYIGLPLSMNYAFLRTSRFTFYATGGMMAEKCVSGQSELLTVSGNSQEVETVPLTESRFQYSTFGSLGVQVDLIKRVGFYLEPGLSYYFDNHSRVVNIYKDDPLQFNLSAGVRFSF